MLGPPYRIGLAQQERRKVIEATEDKTWVMRRGQEVFITQITDRGLVMQYHKVLTYIEYRAVSGVFRTIDTPPPSPPNECVLPPHQRRGGEGVGGQ